MAPSPICTSRNAERRPPPLGAALAWAIALVTLSACASPLGVRPAPFDPEKPRWTSRIDRDHPLVGKIWDAERARFTQRAELIERLASTDLVLLGEKHDNVDHHRLQAYLIREIVDRGRKPAVAFEMLSVDVAPDLAAALSRARPSSRSIRKAVHWDDSGWPPWSQYAPIFEVALRARLPIAAVDLGAQTIAALHDAGLSALDPALAVGLNLERPLPDAARRALEAEIERAHCGHATPALVSRMIDVQVARDAQLAHGMLEAGDASSAGAVLIAGTGHVRRDRGVPTHLDRLAPDLTVATLAFLEVTRDFSEPAAAIESASGKTEAFAFVWFTPAVDRDDPCIRFRRQLEKMRTSRPERKGNH